MEVLMGEEIHAGKGKKHSCAGIKKTSSVFEFKRFQMLDTKNDFRGRINIFTWNKMAVIVSITGLLKFPGVLSRAILEPKGER